MIPRLAALCLLAATPLAAQHPSPTRSAPVEGTDFVVYDGRGRSASLAHILDALGDYDAVLVGEQHDDMIGHGFQASLLGAAFSRLQPERSVVLSLEMFERDVQYVVDEYLQGLISEDHFMKSARPWDDYVHRYRPMVEFARLHELEVVAANAPRRYVNRVSREGPESLADLSETARSFLPPLPYPGPSDRYRAQWDSLMIESMEAMRARQDSIEAANAADEEPDAEEEPEEDADDAEAPGPPGGAHGAGMSPNIIYSQALWDAAMGHAIAGVLDQTAGSLVMHMAGSFHVEKGTGIPERIADYRPGTRVLSIVMQPVSDVHSWVRDEHEGLGDFVVLTLEPPEETEGTGN